MSPHLQASEKAWPCWHLDFGLTPSTTVKQYISGILSHGLWNVVIASLGNEYTPSHKQCEILKLHKFLKIKISI